MRKPRRKDGSIRIIRHRWLWSFVADLTVHVVLGIMGVDSATRAVFGGVAFFIVYALGPFTDPPLHMRPRLWWTLRVRPRRSLEMWERSVRKSPDLTLWIVRGLIVDADRLPPPGSVLPRSNPPVVLRDYEQTKRGFVLFVTLGDWPPRGRGKKRKVRITQAGQLPEGVGA